VKRFFVLVAVGVLALSGCGALADPYAATVNGVRISQDELESELEAILANKAYLAQVDQGFTDEAGRGAVGAGSKTFTTTFVAALLDRRIGFELIDQELERRRLTVTDADRTAAREGLDQSFGEEVLADFSSDYLSELTEDFARVAVLQKALGTQPVDDAAVVAFYEANISVFRDQSCSRHILVDTLEKATAIKTRIDGGEDFAAIARAESADRGGAAGGSAAAGGDLGCTARGSFVPEFQAALDALTPGQISAPVQTQFGFHVIGLIERKTVSLADATPQIRERLAQQAGSENAVGLFVNEAVLKGDIVVNPRYGSFEKGDTPGVKPPPTVGSGTTTPTSIDLPLPPPAPAPAP